MTLEHIGTLPTFVTLQKPPDRGLALTNPKAFSTAYMQFNDAEQTLANRDMPYAIEWMNSVYGNVDILYSEIKNDSDRAEQAKTMAVSAWEDVKNYAIPDGTALSIEDSEEIHLELLKNQLNNELYALNALRETQLINVRG